MSESKLLPIHPGEILLEEFLKPMAIDPAELARDTNLPPLLIQQIIAGDHAITPNIALRLSHYFKLSERFWLNLQSRYDLETEKDHLGDRLNKEVRVFQAPTEENQHPL